MTNSIKEMRDADCILMTGTNTAENHPVISYEVVRAARKGANIIVIDPRRVPMVDNATLFLQIKPGTDVYVFMAMMHIIYREGWANETFIAEQTEGYDEFIETLQQYTPEHAALMSGVPVEKIEAAARIYANGERVSGESVYGDKRGHSAIMYAMGITQRSSGTDIVKILANLTMMCGQIGKPGTGMNPLRGQANVQGACDVGGLVNVYPGYQQVGDDEKRAIIEQKWATPNLPSTVGRTIVEASHDATDGRMHVNYVMGENPMMSDPDTTHVEKALRALDFLVVQDIFPNDTATLAHIILPAASAMEKDGTFTNTERRVQQLHPVVPSPGTARQDWQITTEIAKRFDEKMGIKRAEGYCDYADSSAIFDELTTVTPIYEGMDYERIQEEGLQWPCPTPDHPGTPFLYEDGFTRGKGKFHPVIAQDPFESPDDEYPLTLTTGRVLYHYHSGTMTRRSGPLAWADKGGYVEINAADAAAIGLADKSAVIIHSRRGSVKTRSKISKGVPPGVVFLAFHWREAPANVLTHDIGLDPVAKIPEYKITAVRLENARTKAVSPPLSG